MGKWLLHSGWTVDQWQFYQPRHRPCKWVRTFLDVWRMDLMFQFPVHRVSAIINRFFGEWTYLINFARNILWDGPVKNGGNMFYTSCSIQPSLTPSLSWKNLQLSPKMKYRQQDFRIALAQLLIGTFRTVNSR